MGNICPGRSVAFERLTNSRGRLKYTSDIAPWVDKIILENNVAVLQEGIPEIGDFEKFLAANKNLSVDEFKNQYSPLHTYLQQINFNPTKSKFFHQFVDSNTRPKNDHYEKKDNFSLSPAELALFKKNGFVVIEGSKRNFSREYYRIFNNDLPVFVTADSILHAFRIYKEK